MNGFKYQIILVVRLYKEHKNARTEYLNIYFNSMTNTVINNDFNDGIDMSFEKIVNGIQN